MISDKIKIKVSSFVADIIVNDCFCFGFTKNDNSPNINAFLNKLIPTLVAIRKQRREEIRNILTNEYARKDGENIYDCVNTVIDKVYFCDEELDNLEEYIWIRPTQQNLVCFDEIEESELSITAQEMAVYIRGLLNEYSRFPQYKREAITFDKELDDFYMASLSQHILHFKCGGEKYKVFAAFYKYGYLYNQVNYLVFYDLKNKRIRALPLHAISETYMIQKRYKPSENLINLLQQYSDDCDFDKEIEVGE